jgi:cytochrome c oxidase subunit 4
MSQMNAITRGIVVFIILAVLTAVEFFLARLEAATFLLVLIALAKAGLVVWYFMHLRRVFKPEEGGHE